MNFVVYSVIADAIRTVVGHWTNPLVEWGERNYRMLWIMSTESATSDYMLCLGKIVGERETLTALENRLLRLAALPPPIGGLDGNRTHMARRPPGLQPGAYTSFATCPAKWEGNFI